MVRRLFSAFVLVCLSAVAAEAQVGSGTLRGKIQDKNTNEPLPFVNVVLERGGSQVTGGASDFDGQYDIKPIEPGTYDLIVTYVGYQPFRINGVVINSNKITFQDIALNPGIELKEFEVVQYTVPLIDRDGGASGGTVTREDIAKMPGRTAASIATTVAGASDAGTGGGISIRGARSENTYYYIDGVKVPAGAGTGLPKSAIEEVQVITGGVPANYGDVTGGLVNITTRGPSREFFGGVEYLTSGYKVGPDITDIVGLDKFAFNQVEASLSGPILFRKDSLGNKEKPLLGFFFSGQYTNVVDRNPFYHGDIRVKPEVREQLLNEPARLLPTGTNDYALGYSSEFLRTEDFERIPTRQNAGEVSYLASGKIDITTTPTINLSVGGSIDLQNSQQYRFSNALLNPNNNFRIKENTWRTFIKFTQRFMNRSEEEESRSTIRNAFYTLQLDYSQYANNVEHYVHGDRLFDYGYVGKFTTYRRPFWEPDPNVGGFVQTGEEEYLVTFEPGEQNPELAAINNFYFNNLGGQGIFTQNFEETVARGVIWNGASPRSLYGMWNNIGQVDFAQEYEFRKRLNDQIRMTAAGSADIGQHAIQLGIEYEQLTQRRFDLSPSELWTRARLLTNFHIQEFQNPDSVPPTQILPGPIPFFFYDRLIGSDQRNFDRNLREALGLDPNGLDYIDVDALDPSVFSLDMFSPDELVNQGNGNLVNYVGYDHLGNKLTSKPSFNDFFDAQDADGNFTRLQAPFEPIYMAGYVMDKFAFDDIIFNVGVRVDRYDANQNVLKDPYLWQEAHTAGDEAVQALYNNGANIPRPGNIGDDYVVYVNDFEDPSQIVGYRDGEQWYSATGVELTDATSLQQGGQIRPYLIEGGNAGSMEGSFLSKNAFRDYDPVVNVMPRIAFSFPISDEAVFFAHYDVLTQRPNAIESRLDLMSYAFIHNTGDRLNNPNLRPTKTIDYELGFQQVLSKASSLKLAAFYRELRDQIQVRNVVNAWPRDYRTYDNLDFGTVKGFSATFDLRRTGNVWVRASYTLQFADGTGSGPTTGINLINSGQPNLRTISPLDFDQRHRFQGTIDYRYGGGKDYNGPMLFGKPIFQRTGANIVAILGSGTPYSRSSQVVSEATGATNHLLEGTLNGARLPWQFTTDLQVDRDIPLTFGGKEEGEGASADRAKSANLNIYLLVTNVFNTENIVDVYRYTGSPDNDGYLAQFTDRSQIDPDAFRDLYNAKLANPFFYGAPRTIRLGVRFDF